MIWLGQPVSITLLNDWFYAIHYQTITYLLKKKQNKTIRNWRAQIAYRPTRKRPRKMASLLMTLSEINCSYSTSGCYSGYYVCTEEEWYLYYVNQSRAFCGLNRALFTGTNSCLFEPSNSLTLCKSFSTAGPQMIHIHNFKSSLNLSVLGKTSML